MVEAEISLDDEYLHMDVEMSLTCLSIAREAWQAPKIYCAD